MSIISDKVVPRLWDMCKNTALNLWINKAPTPEYAQQVAEILIGTIGQESSFVYRRQLGNLPQFVGASSICQMEIGSITDSLKVVKRNPDKWKVAGERVLTKNSQYLFLNGSDKEVFMQIQKEEYDDLAIVLMRLHYLRFSGCIPYGIIDQSLYYKLNYNTYLGKATQEQYIKNWQKYRLHVITKEDPIV